MAIHASSTPALARPLLPLPALDRRAIGRDGWSRARSLAARLGGAVRDHLGAAMREAWRAARDAVEAIEAADRLELPPEPLLAPAREGENDTRLPTANAVLDDMARELDRQSIPHGPLSFRSLANEGPLLILPAWLPPLSATLSRRRAIFGPVAAETGSAPDYPDAVEVARPGASPIAGLPGIGDSPPPSDSTAEIPGISGISAEPDTAAEARIRYLRRQLVQAAEHGAALLAVLRRPQLDALTRAIATLDALDGDPDIENDDPAEAEPDELSLCWPEDAAERLDPACAADPDAEHDDADLEPDWRVPWSGELPRLPAGEARP